MEQRLTIPPLGENIENAEVVGVHVEAGAEVDAGQVLLELEAGKATLELPCDAPGVVKQVLVSAGDQVEVGQAFAVIVATEQSDGEAGTPTEPEAAIVATQAPAAAVPDAAPAADAEPPEAPEPGEAPAPKGEEPQTVSPQGLVPAAPSVRRLARELGVDVNTVEGSGPHGRVSAEDVKRLVRERNLRHGKELRRAAPSLPDFSKWGPVRYEPMTGIRRATAEHLSVCWSTVPHVTHFDVADITKLDQLRRKYADRAAAAGGKLTMAVMVVKVAAEALRRFPRFNASIDTENGRIAFKEYVHIGIAVATERGLLVPVLRDADRKNMVQLAAEIDAVARRCREGKIGLGDMAGGTFTVTNLGSIGGTNFTPIVNHPEVAILGLGRASKQPAFDADGKLEARTMLPLSLSYDHRLIDGADAARFTRWVAEAIEEPLLLALEGGG